MIKFIFVSGNTVSQISINNNLTMYLNKVEEPSPDGSGSFSFALKKKVDDEFCEYKNLYMIPYVINLNLCKL